MIVVWLLCWASERKKKRKDYSRHRGIICERCHCDWCISVWTKPRSRISANFFITGHAWSIACLSSKHLFGNRQRLLPRTSLIGPQPRKQTPIDLKPTRGSGSGHRGCPTYSRMDAPCLWRTGSPEYLFHLDESQLRSMYAGGFDYLRQSLSFARGCLISAVR